MNQHSHRPDAPIEEQELDGASGTLLPQGSEKVLIVDDDKSCRRFLARILSMQGYEVFEAGDAVEASQACEEAESIALVIVDIMMPVITGRELAGVLAEIRPETRFLFMSGYNRAAIEYQGLLEEGFHYLAKPFNVSEVAVRVRTALDRPLPPSLPGERLQAQRVGSFEG